MMLNACMAMSACVDQKNVPDEWIEQKGTYFRYERGQ